MVVPVNSIIIEDQVRTTKVSSKHFSSNYVGGTIVDVKIINKGHGYN